MPKHELFFAGTNLLLGKLGAAVPPTLTAADAAVAAVAVDVTMVAAVAVVVAAAIEIRATKMA
jgi:hypothetical protein